MDSARASDASHFFDALMRRTRERLGNQFRIIQTARGMRRRDNVQSFIEVHTAQGVKQWPGEPAIETRQYHNES